MKNLTGMMKQAQELQGRMAEVQAEIEQMAAEGSAGGGLVIATVGGKGDLKALRIDPSLAKPDEIEILEDLVIAAHADAKSKIEAALQEKMASLTGGLSLPPGLKLF